MSVLHIMQQIHVFLTFVFYCHHHLVVVNWSHTVCDSLHRYDGGAQFQFPAHQTQTLCHTLDISYRHRRDALGLCQSFHHLTWSIKTLFIQLTTLSVLLSLLPLNFLLQAKDLCVCVCVCICSPQDPAPGSLPSPLHRDRTTDVRESSPQQLWAKPQPSLSLSVSLLHMSHTYTVKNGCELHSNLLFYTQLNTVNIFYSRVLYTLW